MFAKRSTENFVIFSPLEGTLVQNGRPLVDTKIIRRLSWNGNEEGLIHEFTTDKNGYFKLPIYEEALSLGILNQFVGKADLEINTGSENIYLWTSSKFFPEIFTETNGQITDLVCDINAEEIAVPMGPTSILTRCRWKNMPK
ncbi:MAG: DUF6795 domain-containing protein [Spongiibacteraceae bacterium]